jgi:alanine dehydrogenase
MRVGLPKEIKNHEYRVGLVPASVGELVSRGHEVWVETQAGSGIGCRDEDYRQAGARIAPDAATIFDNGQLIVKVKEPQLSECKQLRSDQTLFTFLHLAADRDQAEALMAAGVTAIAYETVTANDGSLPLLAPMSQVAGRMSVQVGAHCLQNSSGGAGVLLGGVPGVAPGKVVILGGGVAGGNALEMAVGLQADVTVLDKNLKRLGQLSERFGSRIRALYSTTEAIEREVLTADLVIGAVLVAGAAAPKLVSRAMVAAMRPGSVLVDIAIDQGGCFETSRPTTHADPTYVIDGVVHYCVTNMPGAVARTTKFARNNATIPYVIALAEHGTEHAMRNDPHLAAGLNVKRGSIQHAAVARDLGLEYVKGIAA